MFNQAIYKPTSSQIPGPETNPWYWNPNRCEVRFAPEWFRSKVKEMSEDLEVTWDQIHERWLVWMRKPSIQNPICRGWKLLFVVHDGVGGYVPLDERTLAKIYSISADKWGNGKRYMDAVQREAEREYEKYDSNASKDDYNHGKDDYIHTQPFIGYGTRQGASKVVGQ